MNLSLCMIVRDSARTLGACLTSIRPWVDEIIIIDTGSHDNTPQIAQKYGARLFHFPWCDDFARARNESLRYAQGEWIFWMDSDDTIDADNGRKLAALVRQSVPASVLGYVVQVHCPTSHGSQKLDVTVVDHVKLFRNSPAIRFEFRIHEQVLPSIRRVGGTVEWTDIFVSHSGSDQSPAGRQAKQNRDLRILEIELADRPHHPFTLFNLGMTWADIGDHHRASEFLRKSIEASSADESHLRKAYALLVASLIECGEIALGEQYCTEGLSHFPNDAELLFRKGLLAQQAGQPRVAADAYRVILSTTRSRHFSSIDCGVTGHKARHNLGIALLALGQYDLAEAQWRQAVEEAPHFTAGWQALADCLLDQQKWASSYVLAKKLHDLGHMNDAAVLRAELYYRNGNTHEAINYALQVLDVQLRQPEHVWALNRIARIFFELRQWPQAENALKALTSLEPANASAMRNLKVVQDYM